MYGIKIPNPFNGRTLAFQTQAKRKDALPTCIYLPKKLAKIITEWPNSVRKMLSYPPGMLKHYQHLLLTEQLQEKKRSCQNPITQSTPTHLTPKVMNLTLET